MDLESIGTGLTVLGASQITKDAVSRMLAPTADYIGTGILSSTKAGVNLARVLVRAARKKNNWSDGGQIPPRVLKAILDDAPFCEDEVAAEYMGGVLASSWTKRRRDDRALAFLSTIGSLSTYSLRFHYLLYSCAVDMFFMERFAYGEPGAGIHVPWDALESAMSFAEEESPGDIIAHCITALGRAELADIPYAGSSRHYRETFADDSRLTADALNLLKENGGLLFCPTKAGIELFLAGCGVEGYRFDQIPEEEWAGEVLRFDCLDVRTSECTAVRVTYRT